MALRALFLLLLLAPLGAGAQMPTGTGLSLVFSPAYPRPYEQVTVTVQSTTVNLAASDIAISVDGAIIEEGSRSATFRVGAAGKRAVVRASVSSVEGTETTQSTLVPADLSLIVEPAATSHLFYDGGLLVPSEGRLRIVALTDLRTSGGTRIAEKDISYRWKLGDKILESDSGFGRNVLAATAPARYRDAKVTATATSRDGTVMAESSVSISPADPVLRIYAADPLSGTNFSSTLSGTLGFSGSEAGFRAVPYFFKETPSYSWRLNSAQSGTQESITVRSSGGSGSAILSASASLPDAAASASLTLRFDSLRTGLFGF